MADAAVSQLEDDYTRHMFPSQEALDDLDSDDELEHQLEAIANGPMERPISGSSKSKGPMEGPLSGSPKSNGPMEGLTSGSSKSQLDQPSTSKEHINGSPRHHGKPSMSANGSPVSSQEPDRYGFFGGKQFTNRENEKRLPLQVLRRREVKWLDMLENWEKWMNKRFKKVKDRCRKGIPPGLRARTWQYLCGSKMLMDKKENRGKFDHFMLLDGDPKCIDDIRKDLDRQYPEHEMFARQSGHGQDDLFQVLKAYSIHSPKVGYCQAQAPLAAVLLMHMPAEQAFWCLTSICDKYLPGYYSPGLEQIQIDGAVFFGLLKKVAPQTYKHMKAASVDPLLYMTEWFMCVYARTLPWPSVLRVWDMFLCEGIKVLFRVGLVLIKSVLGRPEQLAECPSMFEIVERIRNIPEEYMQEDYLVQECGRLSINEKDMEKETEYQAALRKDSTSKKKKKPRTPSDT